MIVVVLAWWSLVPVAPAPAAPAAAVHGDPPAGADAGPGAGASARAVLAAAVPTLADDGDGLRTETSVLYVVDPDAGATHVTVNLTLENQVPDQVDGPYIQQTYFSHFSVPVLTEATNFAAVDGDGTALAVAEEGIDGDPWVGYATIDLQPNIYFGQRQSIQLTFQLPNQAARATGLSRANDAFVSFPVFADGDPGLASVEIRLPDRYDVEVVAGDLAREERDGQIVLTATAIADPHTFIPVVVASDDDHLVSRTVDLDGIAVEALAWPDDPQWADFVLDQLGAAIPELTEMTGQPWPTEQDLEVTETAAPYAYGYAGWYEELDNSISIGDALDPRVIVHELSHVWFNSELFADRWVNEAFAEEYATDALDRLGQPQGAPPAPDRAGHGAFALNDWGNPSILDEDSEATEDYGYAASWYVLDQIEAEIGIEGLREVIAMAAADQISYAGDPEPETEPRPSDWQRLLDLLEEVGGSGQAGALFDTYVVNEEQRPVLAARAAARTEYQGLAERGGTWTPPLEVRELLAGWEFESVAAQIAEADQVLEARAEIEAVLDGTDVERIGLEDLYERATDTSDVVAVTGATLEAAEDYREASERHRSGPGLLGSVGLFLSGTGDRLDDAREELERGDAQASLQASDDVLDRLDHATRDGLLRVATVALLGAVVMFAVRQVRRRRRRLVTPLRITAMPRPWPPPMPPPPRAPSLPPSQVQPRSFRPPAVPAPTRAPPDAATRSAPHVPPPRIMPSTWPRPPSPTPSYDPDRGPGPVH